MSSFRFGSLRAPLGFGGKNSRKSLRKLERANTVATGLGHQVKENDDEDDGDDDAFYSGASSTSSSATYLTSTGDKPQPRHLRQDLRKDSLLLLNHRNNSTGSGGGSNRGSGGKIDGDPSSSSSAEKLHLFCRGSLKRLKHAESKVGVAKRDMEEILEMAKSVGDLRSIGSPPLDLDSLDASLRLANDSRLAIEAQLEMRKIIHQFTSLLQEEEDKVAFKADLLQRRSSQIHFDYTVPPRSKGGDRSIGRSRMLSSSGSSNNGGGCGGGMEEDYGGGKEWLERDEDNI